MDPRTLLSAPNGAERAQQQKRPGDGRGMLDPLGSNMEARPGEESSDASTIPKAPSLSLPKGGGAIKSIGEKFDVNLNTGTGSIGIPIPISSSRGNMQPDIALKYDSGSGNGVFGLGWSISLPSISRKTDKGLPQYRDSQSDGDDLDVFTLAGAEDLVPLMKPRSNESLEGPPMDGLAFDESPVGQYQVRRYAPRIEGNFLRIERWQHKADSSDIYWRVISAQNVTTIFGNSKNSRISDPNVTGGGHRIFSWLAAERYDCHGNAMIFQYAEENSVNVAVTEACELNRSSLSRTANRYLKSIRYGNTTPNRSMETWVASSAHSLPEVVWRFSLVLDYGDHNHENPDLLGNGLWDCRQDPFSSWRSGFEIRTYRLCQRILMFHHFDQLGEANVLVRSLDLSYDHGKALTYLTSAVSTGYIRKEGRDGYDTKSFPPLQYQYSSFPPDDILEQLPVQSIDAAELHNVPVGVDGTSYLWADLNGEGIPGILSMEAGSWYYKRNLTPSDALPTDELVASGIKFGEMSLLPSGPVLSPSISTNYRLQDVASNGTLDFVLYGPDQWGYFERAGENTWANFRPFEGFPNIDINAKGVAFVDLTGDGLADIFIYQDVVYYWYQSMGEEGYGPPAAVTQPNDEMRGPVCAFSDQQSTIFLADFSGDGLVDLVRIRNGDVVYWPNSGYGTFGPLVRMANAPYFDRPDTFNAQRLRLADIDGSGTTDLLYIGAQGLDIYLNEAGNSFSPVKRVSSFPSLDSVSSVSTTDLLGNGTSCVVWSSPLPYAAGSQMRYIDLMRGAKPHLMTHSSNNMGKEVSMEYAPSTKFYLNSEIEGRPWLTRLPFPVQCVERVISRDLVSNITLVNHYEYHHGYFDGKEREFRGFALVEQWDSEEYLPGDNEGENSSAAQPLSSQYFSPPVHTKTWFHTGTFLQHDVLSRQMAHEYYGFPRGNSQDAEDAFYANLLEDSVITGSPTGDAETYRECYRALKGRRLRTEIFSDDKSAYANRPYCVTESNCEVSVVQPVTNVNQHAVIFVKPRENIEYHTERKTSDPRIEHNLVLDVGEYGNVKKSVKVAYGRPAQDEDINSNKFLAQSINLITYTEHAYTKPLLEPDNYRTPMLCESRGYEITGLTPTSGRSHFTVEDFTAHDFRLLESLPDTPFETPSEPDVQHKRMISGSKTRYRRNDLTGLSPDAEVESLAIPGTFHVLSFTPGLVAKVLTRSARRLITDETSTFGGVGDFQGGYVDLEADHHWWKPMGTVAYHREASVDAAVELAEARKSFFVPCRFTDPFRNDSFVEYDEYKLFPVRQEDAVKNVATASPDYRVLAPKQVVDINDNISQVAFDALGAVSGMALMGKQHQNVGDRLNGFEANLDEKAMEKFFADPNGSVVADLLNAATTRIITDMTRFYRTHGQRACYTATIARETHAQDPEPLQGKLCQVAFNYFDGSQRTIQTKRQGTKGSVSAGQLGVQNRWIGSGWTLYNNKGETVKEFEPFFDDTHELRTDARVGHGKTTFYDPLGRVVAQLYADHTWEKHVIDAWSNTFFDANNNCYKSGPGVDPRNDPDVGQYFAQLEDSELLPSWYENHIGGSDDEKDAAEKSAVHAGTSTTYYVDALGRPFLTAQLYEGDQNAYDQAIIDIQGNQTEIINANGRKVMHYDYNLTGEPIHQSSMDCGEQWSINNCTGNPIVKWENKDRSFRYAYDNLRRPTKTVLYESDNDHDNHGKVILKTVYGEDAPENTQRNLRGKAYQVFDQAGVSECREFDFKSNLLSGHRQFARDYKTTLDWEQSVALLSGVYVSSSVYDALNRVIQTTEDGNSCTRVYGRSGQIETITSTLPGEVTDQAKEVQFATNISYNARNQLTSIQFGNGAVGTRAYDPRTFLTTNIRVTRPRAQESGGQLEVLQDLSYTYDAVGNITQIRNRAQDSIFFRGQRIDPTNSYTYDTFYRLIEASGREHVGQTQGEPAGPHVPKARSLADTNLDHPGNSDKMSNYFERYSYDLAGNMKSCEHRMTDPRYSGWTRTYAYEQSSLLEPAEKNNVLTSTEVRGAREDYKYEGIEGRRGNVTGMPHLPVMNWDALKQLRSAAQQIVNTGVPEMTYYVYDATGKRVRTVTEREGGTEGHPDPPSIMRERLYLTTLEVYREYPAAQVANDEPPLPSLERTTLSILDGQQRRMALVETRTLGNEQHTPRQLIRYQVANQLDSCSIELDERAAVISYEEYFAFGATSYYAVDKSIEVPRKRYRYTGKELDQENGFYYYGSRYYAAYLGRFISPDPSFIADGPNMFAYVHNNPISHIDPTGNWDVDGKVLFVATVSALAIVGLGVATGGAALAAIPVILEAAGVDLAVASAVSVAAADTAYVAGIVGTAGGIASTTKQAVDLANGVDPKTGQPYNNQSGSEALGQVIAGTVGAAIGIHGSLGGLPGGPLGGGGSSGGMVPAGNSGTSAMTNILPSAAVAAPSVASSLPSLAGGASGIAAMMNAGGSGGAGGDSEGGGEGGGERSINKHKQKALEKQAAKDKAAAEKAANAPPKRYDRYLERSKYLEQIKASASKLLMPKGTKKEDMAVQALKEVLPNLKAEDIESVTSYKNLGESNNEWRMDQMESLEGDFNLKASGFEMKQFTATLKGGDQYTVSVFADKHGNYFYPHFSSHDPNFKPGR